MTELRHVLVCYDIADSKRLRHVHKTVRDFGLPLQYSVFACRLTRLDRAQLESRLLKIIHTQQDQVVLVDLGRAEKGDSPTPGVSVLGLQQAEPASGVVVL